MANIQEIAKMAGVSKTTVSRVINNKPDVKPETRNKIAELIRKYDFQPNASATAIAHKRAINTIGLIIPYDANYIFGNPFNAEIMRGVALETNAAGYHLLLCHFAKEDYVAAFKQKKVAGFILISPGKDHKGIVTRIREIDAPFVSTSRVPYLPDIHFVEVDNFYGASLAVEHLIQLGHRRIGIIKGHDLLTSSSDRFAGYCATLKKYDIPYDARLVQDGYASIDSGYKAMSNLLVNSDLSAVFVSSDLMAIGAIGAVSQTGRRVPDDISVVGFDNIPLAGSLNPPLTTVDQQACLKGRLAAEMLIDIIEGRGIHSPPNIEVSLIVRNSTKAVPV
ncbi:MAG: LacI family DNA-binding transcriptional regulator [Negativicutes bacterium]|nr:LacI family DNA-binding transcriptional regulator [Negativicutes bacterium]